LSPGFSADRFSVEPVSADRGVSFGHKWWNPAFRWCKGKTYTTSVNSPNGIGKLTDTDYLFSFQHDGFGNLRATVRAAGNTYIDNQEYSYIPGWDGGMYLGFIFGGIYSGEALECHVSSPRILFADYGTETLADKLVVDGGASATLSVATVAEDDTVPMVRFPSVSLGSGCSLSVAPTNGNVALSLDSVNVAGAAALALQNGVRASLGDFNFTGMDGGLTVTGEASFGETLSITVPSEWKSQHVCTCLIDGSGMTGSLPDIAAIRVALSNGSVLSGEDLQKFLRLANGKLTIDFRRGLIIYIQ